jgi:hypothetical protein
VLDCLKPISHKRLIEHELEGFGIRLNKRPPAIAFRRKDKGGLNFSTTVQTPRLDLDSATPLRLPPLPGATKRKITRHPATWGCRAPPSA